MIRFLDGFDHYTVMGGSSYRKWDSVSALTSTGFTTGRYGGYGVAPSSAGIHKTMDSYETTWIIGFAILVVDQVNLDQYFFAIGDTGVVNTYVIIRSADQHIAVYNGNNDLILDTGFAAPVGVWFFLEMKILYGASGAVTVQIDGTNVGSATGVDTTNGASGNNWFVIRSNGLTNHSQNLIDDLYILDTSGSTNNDFLGESRIQYQAPATEGATNNFLPSTPGTTNNALMVTGRTDFTETNGKYNYTGAVNNIDLYSLGSFVTTGLTQVFGIQLNVAYRKDDVGNRKITPIVRSSLNNYDGNEYTCSSTYTLSMDIWESDPSSAAPWSAATLNTAQFGLKVTS